jgi:hypothetical protein
MPGHSDWRFVCLDLPFDVNACLCVPKCRSKPFGGPDCPLRSLALCLQARLRKEYRSCLVVHAAVPLHECFPSFRWNGVYLLSGSSRSFKSSQTTSWPMKVKALCSFESLSNDTASDPRRTERSETIRRKCETSQYIQTQKTGGFGPLVSNTVDMVN